MIEAGQVAECSDGSDSHGTLHATEGLQRLHNRAEGPPSGDLRMEFLFQALEPVSVCGDRPDIFLADIGWAGVGRTILAQPAQVRRIGVLADIMPQQKGYLLNNLGE